MTPSRPWLPWLLCCLFVLGSPPLRAQPAPEPVGDAPDGPDRPEEPKKVEGEEGADEEGADEEPKAIRPTKPMVEPEWPLPTRLHRRHKEAIVRITTAGGVGTGFLYHSPRHVATAFHVVSAGRSIQVALPGGGERTAKAVAVDPAHDLAILELDAPIEGVEPLTAWSGEPAEIGTQVVMIGHPFSPYASSEARLEGLLDWTVTTGIVSGRSEELVQTDAAVNPGNSGGPMFAPDGRVLGVISFKLSQAEGISFAIAASHLEVLRLAIGKQPVYDGQWSSYRGVGAMWQSEDVASFFGFSVMFGVLIRDRVAMGLRIGALSSDVVPDDSPVFEREHSRALIEAEVARRFLLLLGDTAPLYVHAGGGLMVGLDSVSEGTLRVQEVDAACAPGMSCPVGTTIDRAETSDVVLRPMGTVSVLVGGLEAHYGFLLELGDFGESAHQIGLGLVF